MLGAGRRAQRLYAGAPASLRASASPAAALRAMDALLLCYASSSDSDSDSDPAPAPRAKRFKSAPAPPACSSLPPPPPAVFSSVPTAAIEGWTSSEHGGRLRSFPHVPGNYALHVYIPVALSASIQTKLSPYLHKAVSLFPGLRSMTDDDLSINAGSKQDMKLANEFHISLGRTVPIRIHQVDTMVHMLRRKFDRQKRFWIDFGNWEVFVNDDRTRSFLSLEVVATGYPEIKSQVSLVDDVYRLHNLPTFYSNPRPHISLAWALGDVMHALATVARELNAMVRLREEKTCLWTFPATKVECKIGQKLHPIWAVSV